VSGEDEDGRGGAAKEEEKSKTSGGRQLLFLFCQVGSTTVWLEIGLGLEFLVFPINV
jgi:hypothetical protein